MRKDASIASSLAYKKNKAGQEKLTSISPVETLISQINSKFKQIDTANHSLKELAKIDNRALSRTHMNKN